MNQEYPTEVFTPEFLGLHAASCAYLNMHREIPQSHVSAREYVAQKLGQEFRGLIENLYHQNNQNPKTTAAQIEEIISIAANSLGFRMDTAGKLVRVH